MKLRMLVAIASLALAGVAVPASAEEGSIVVTVPFEFVAGTQTLPAGKYTVSRTSSPTSPLLISSHEQVVLLLPEAFDDTHLGDASLDFKEIEGQHVLSQIKTPEGVYTIDNSREAKRLTKMANDHTRTTGMTPSGGQ